MKPYFIFKNISSEDYLSVNKLPSILKAAKDIEKIEVPGMDGFLTKDNKSYKGSLKPVECTIKNLNNIDFISAWLDGSSDIIFSNEPDKVYKATIINQIEFSKILRQYHKFIIIFECQPHKYSINNNPIVLSMPGTLYNQGKTNSKPIIKIFGTGSIDLTINDTAISLTNIVDYVTINSELMDCYKDMQLMNNYMSGEFPLLIPGDNTINWAGNITKIEITPNWRWL